MRIVLRPIEQRTGYWPAIALFELWFGLAGLFLGLQQYALLGLFLGWNLFRLILSPFLRFVLFSSPLLLLLSAAAFGLGLTVGAATDADDQRFLMVVIGVIAIPFVVLLHLWQSAHFARLFAAFESAGSEERGSQ